MTPIPRAFPDYLSTSSSNFINETGHNSKELQNWQPPVVPDKPRYYTDHSIYSYNSIPDNEIQIINNEITNASKNNEFWKK